MVTSTKTNFNRNRDIKFKELVIFYSVSHENIVVSKNALQEPDINQNKASSVAILIIITFFVTWLPNQVTSIIIYMRAVKEPHSF